MNSRVMGLTLVVGLIACDGSTSDQVGPSEQLGPSESEYVIGLRLASAARASDDGHLGELVAHEGYVYLANNFGITTMRLEADGGLTMTDNSKDWTGLAVVCHSLAIHRPSDSLYCAADFGTQEQPRVEVFDLSDPSKPALREPLLLERSSVRDIVVVDDTLWISAYDNGLWTATLSEAGVASELSQTSVEGNVRFVAPVGEGLLAVLLADVDGPGTQLRLLAPEGGELVELDRLGLSGPPLGLSVDAGVGEGAVGAKAVAVALGSRGLAIIDITSAGEQQQRALALRQRLTPPAVVAHPVLAGDLAFAIGLSGAFAWDLGALDDAGNPRLFGFGPESRGAAKRSGTMLHAVLHEGELLVSDWTWVERWTVDRTGEVVDLDVPRGVFVGPSQPARWQLRNPGPLTLRAEHWALGEHLFDVEVGPFAVETLELDAATLDDLLGSGGDPITVGVRVFDPAVRRDGTPLSFSTVVVLRRDSASPVPPAVGERMPEITLADVDDQLFTVPDARPRYLIWYSPDCAAIWPELEDVAWAARGGLDLGRGDPLYVSQHSPIYGFADRWGFEAVEFGLFGPMAPPSVDETNAASVGADLMSIFRITDLPGDVDTSDYSIDATGTVRAIERLYRGPWSLAVLD